MLRYQGSFSFSKFSSLEIFLLKFEKSCCDNIEITLGKTFKLKCDINFFEITLPPHRCLHGNFPIIFGGCSLYSFVVMIFILFIVINLFEEINLRSSLSGNVLEKMYSLYILKTPRKTNVLTLTFFS